MMVSNDAVFTGVTWATYATSLSWNLVSGNGVKTVYAKFRDAAGNVSAAVSDTITLSSGTTVAPVAPATPASPSGVTLVKMAGDPKVYVVKDGVKTWIQTAAEFMAAGYDWNAIQTVSAEALAGYSDSSSSAPITAGYQLMRASGDPKVYKVENGVKTWVQTAEQFNAAGYDWNAIQVVGASTLSVYPDSSTPVTPVVGGTFGPITYGTVSEAVRALQQFLKNQGADIYPEGLVTGRFGPLTRAAVQRFQEKYGISGPGKAGYGNFGPATSAKANALNK